MPETELTRRKAVLVALAGLTGATSGRASHAQPGAEGPARRLRGAIDSFRLALRYEGENDGPAPALTLAVPGSEPPTDVLPRPVVRISREQADRAIDLLTTSGPLHRAEIRPLVDLLRSSEAERRYGLIAAGASVGAHADLGWGRPLLGHLGGLSAALGGEAGAELGRLIDALRPRFDREATAHATDPVEVNGLAFQAVGTTAWDSPAGKAKAEIELSLRVTNRSPQTLRFNRFDTVEIRLVDAQGVTVRRAGGRDKTDFLKPLVLRPGESRIVPRRGTLERVDGGRSFRLSGRDGTGGWWCYDGLTPGRYTLFFDCRNDQEAVRSSEGFCPLADRSEIQANQPPYWFDEATTRGLSVRLNG